jgi:hypothetical protein
VLPACGLEESRGGSVDVVELEEGGLRRTVFVGTSRLFACSLAAEHVCALLQQLMVAVVEAIN